VCSPVLFFFFFLGDTTFIVHLKRQVKKRILVLGRVLVYASLRSNDG